jgi:hypothetical protein
MHFLLFGTKMSFLLPPKAVLSLPLSLMHYAANQTVKGWAADFQTAWEGNKPTDKQSFVS